jgi:hypothetical protein
LELRALSAVSELSDDFRGGKLPVTRIVDKLIQSSNQNFRPGSREVIKVLKGMGLQVRQSTGGINYLFWDHSLEKKMSTISTNATISTISTE